MENIIKLSTVPYICDWIILSCRILHHSGIITGLNGDYSIPRNTTKGFRVKSSSLISLGGNKAFSSIFSRPDNYKPNHPETFGCRSGTDFCPGDGNAIQASVLVRIFYSCEIVLRYQTSPELRAKVMKGD